MPPYVVLDKKRGETPLAALQAWKTLKGYEEVPAAYAGRLDPMAEGKLLVLLGEECKRQEHYRGLDKEYEIDVLFDVGSDTGDALGLVEYAGKESRIDLKLLERALRKQKGKHERPYPAFSSKTVNGKPLFLYALEGALDTIAIPTHCERIYEIEHLSSTKRTAEELCEEIGRFLALVPITEESSKALGANFRIREVEEHWRTVFEASKGRSFVSVRLRVVCGSGTYMRALAGRLGEAMHTKAIALSIRRTRIGKRLGTWWLKTYR